ncbi:MAG: hypothetical protein HOY71_19950 [Nonomuraea sp.]|nr:hypothetical protein [Nonomuraea sp.]
MLELVNGRRSCRDLAFLLGRGLYPVTVEISRLLGEGAVALVHREPERESLPRREKGASGITAKSAARLRSPFRLKARTPEQEQE